MKTYKVHGTLEHDGIIIVKSKSAEDALAEAESYNWQKWKKAKIASLRAYEAEEIKEKK